MNPRLFLVLALVLLLAIGAAHAQDVEPSWMEVTDLDLQRRSNPSLRRVRDDSQRPVGELRQFRIPNAQGESVIVNATLAHVSNHAYFYTYSFDPARHPPADSRTLTVLGQGFDQSYPRILGIWGITDPPHIEGDRRVVVLFTSGGATRGYYASRVDMPQERNRGGGETGFIKMIYRGQRRSPNLRSVYLGALEHEFWHMVHHKRGGNHARWVEEGFAVLHLHLLSGIPPGRTVAAMYLQNPHVQMNHPVLLQNVEYGGATLFVSYLYERFGLDFLRQLAFHPQQGLDALDALLAAHGAGISADDVFTDWVIANFLLDNRRENGRFGYPQLWTPDLKPARRLRYIYELPFTYDHVTSPYSAAYYELWPAALDRSLPLLFRFSPAEAPQDAWLQLVQVLPNAIDVQRFSASQQGDGAIAAALRHDAQRFILVVSPYTPGDRRRSGPVSYSLAFSQQPANLTPFTSAAAGQITSQSAAAAVDAASVTFSGQVNQPATDLGALGRIYRASHDSGPALVVYKFVSPERGELAFWVTGQEIDAAAAGCVKASADRRIAASKQANNNVIIAMGPDVENKTFHAIFDGGVSGVVSGLTTTYDGPPGAGCQ